MRKLYQLSTLAVALLLFVCANAQDFSNKGRDFWLCFPSHVPSGNNLANQYVYITSDQNSSGTVSYNGNITSWTVTANTITTVPITRSLAYISPAESGNPVNKGIEVKVNSGQPSVVVYTEIYAAARTEASLILPVNVLGRKYRVISYNQNGNATGSDPMRSQFQIIAVEQNTTVQIQLWKNGSISGSPFTITLPNIGDVYQYQETGNPSLDLSGTYIESIATANEPCKRIAVFSGSSSLAINNQGCSGNSYDPLMQQCYPITTWGKNFGVVPILQNSAGYQARVLASEDNTNVNYGGTNVVLNAGQIYPSEAVSVSAQTQPIFITADKPISVTQYLLSQNCAGGNGDPEMVILNPIEQNIKNITIFTSIHQNISTQVLNVLIPTAGASNFKINGNQVGGFITMPANPNYSYLQYTFPTVQDASYTLTADSGFNAVCYGLGNVETYGYSAGTNVLDLYQFIQVHNPYATVNFPAACQSQPFSLSIVLPYIPSQLTWTFPASLGFPTVTQNNPPVDSTWTINGKPVYRFQNPNNPYTILLPGVYSIMVTAQNPTADNCNGLQEIPYDLQVFPPPQSGFTFTNSGCLNDSVHFFSAPVSTGGRPVIHHYWNFGDASTSNVTNPVHLYGATGTYLVKYSLITDVGCLSDTTTQFVPINPPPTAHFSVGPPFCAGNPVTFIDNSNSGAPITQWHWNFGDGVTADVNNGNPIPHTYASAGTYTVTLWVQAGSCQSTIYAQTITIGTKPTAAFTFGGACLPSGFIQFTDQSTPTGAITGWSWNFGDGSPVSTVQNATHTYASAGPFNVILTVTNNSGCSDDTMRIMNSVYAQPHADFNMDSATSCAGNTVHFTDASNSPNSTDSIYYWNFGDGSPVLSGTAAAQQNPSHSYATPGTYSVKHWITSSAGCPSDTMLKTVTVVPLPTASFTVSNPLCAASAITFTSTSSANAGSISSYSWTVNGTSPPNNTSPILNYTPASAGNYTVVLNITTSNGCTAQTTQTITVNQKPVANFTFGGVCLPNGSTQFTDQSTPAGVNGWSWNFGDGGTSTLQNPVHVYATTGPFNVTLTVSLNGCTDDTTRIMDKVYAQPHADFTMDSATSCAGNTVHFTDASNSPNSTDSIYYWNFGDGSPVLSGNTAAQQNPSHSYATPATYSVKHWITSAAGCPSDTMLKTVTVVALPTAGFTVSTPLCQGSTITFTSTSNANAGTITNYDWTVNGVLQSNHTNILTYNPAGAGALTVTLSVITNNGCTSQTTQTVNVNVKPLANFTFGGACLPSGSTQFTDLSTPAGGTGVSTWNWNFGDGGTSTLQNPVHIYATSGPFNVTLTVTTANGCTDDTVKIMDKVYAQPHADFTMDSATSCAGNTVHFTDASNSPSSTDSIYYWNFGDGSPVLSGNTAAQQNPSHSYTTPGTYSVKHWIISAAGCMSDTMTKTVTVVALPTASFTVSNPVCEQGNILFTSTSVANAGTITGYTWTVNGSSPPNNTLPTLNYTPAASGNYTVVLTVTTSNGCNAQSSQTINVHPKPTVDFTFGNACLPAGAMQFTNGTTISDGTQAQLVYAWNFGDGGTAGNILNPVHNYAATGPFNVTLTATSGNGCVNSIVKSVNTIYAQPQAAFNAPPEVCNGSAVNFTDASTAPNNTVASWNWNFGDGGTSNQQNPSHTYAVPGSYNVTLTVTSQAGCTSNVATKTVVVNPLPTANFNASVPDCLNQNISFTDASVPNAGIVQSWSWNFGDGGTSTSQNPSHTYSAAGSYSVSLQVTSSKGCVSNVFTKSITVHVLPVANFVMPQSCLYDPFSQFNDASAISNGSITQWSWNFGDGGTSTQQNPQHTYTAVGPYNVTLTATSNNGCSNSVTKQFFVNGAVPVPSYTIQPGTSFCSGATVNLTDNSTVVPGSVIKLEIYWDYLNNPSVVTVDNTPAPGKIYSHAYAPTTTTQNVTIRYVAYSGQTCLQYIDKVITLMAKPSLYFNSVNGMCADVPAFQITQAGISNGLPGSGVFSGPGVSPTGMFDPATAGAGSHTIRYTYNSTAGCSDYVEQTIQVYPVPVANAGPDKFLIQGGTVTLTPAINASYPITYLWTPPVYLDNPNTATPKASPPDDFTYTLKITSDKGCSSTDKVFVKVLKNVLIPNIFSPNGDGVHDKWVIPYLSSYPGCTVDVYNRYGQLIFHSAGYTEPWDGTVNGKPVPVGTYYYIVDPKNGRQKLAGYVDVIR